MFMVYLMMVKMSINFRHGILHSSAYLCQFRITYRRYGSETNMGNSVSVEFR